MLTNKRLIESTERITFEEDATGLFGEIPYAFRVTSIGVYHIKRWAAIFPYLDAVVFDTPIFDRDTLNTIQTELEEFAISKRFDRTIAFRDYLASVWHSSNLTPAYFNWPDMVSHGEDSFKRVERAIQKAEARKIQDSDGSLHTPTIS